MSDTCCTFAKPEGTPCAARPLPGSAFCLFHDPDHQQALAQSGRKGASQPRGHPGPFPRVLLTAAGTPPTFLIHENRREPSPAAGHLLRVYPPLAPEVEALLAAEPPPDSGTQPPSPDGSPLQELSAVDAGDGAAWYRAAEFLPPAEPAAPPSAPPPLARNGSSPATPTSDPSDLSHPSHPSDPSPPLVSSRLLPTTPSPGPLAGGGAPQGRTAVMAGPPSAAALLQRLSTA